MKIEWVVLVTAVAGGVLPRVLLTTAVVALSTAIPWMKPQRQQMAMKVLRVLSHLMETVTRSPFQIAAAGFSVRGGTPGDPPTKRSAGKEPDDDG